VTNQQKILVIKLGALGDFIQAAGPFKSIRIHHKSEDITLLTTTKFVDLANASPWFDKIKIDTRPKATEVKKWLSFRNWIRNSAFSRIYDLQTSDRSNFYYRIIYPFNKLNPKPDWSGIASGCSHPHENPLRDSMHTIERQKEQLHFAGIENVAQGDFSWVNESIEKFNVQNTFALLVPGGAAHRLEKRWPAQYFEELVQYIASKKIQPVLIGSKEEKKLLDNLANTNQSCVSLAGKTNLFDLFALARKSKFAIGNDTGPMHIAAVCGCKTIVLYASESDPKLCAQRGDDVTIFQKNKLTDIIPEEIIDFLRL